MVLIFSVLENGTAQFQGNAGCNDPQALNFNPAATQNDGSCLYPITTYSPEFIGNLPSEVEESSGLVLHQNCLWTHNDSGWDPNLFCLDTANAALMRTIWVSKAENRDWEDITKDETHLFIGDFGNNNGNRDDLQIYKLPLALISNDTIEAEGIAFEYPDQTDFTTRPQNNNFDMEAMISLGDSLYLFSKNWLDLQTRVYALPKEAGTYEADLRDSFNVNGLITGASFREEDSLLVLVGYSPFLTPFAYLFWDYTGTQFFSGNKRKIELTIPFHQVEAIDWNPNGRYFFISNERFNNVVNISPKLHRLYVDQWLDNSISNTTSPFPNDSDGIAVFPNPSQSKINIHFPGVSQSIEASIYTSEGLAISRSALNFTSGKAELDVSTWKPGLYYMVLLHGGRYIVKSVIVQ